MVNRAGKTPPPSLIAPGGNPSSASETAVEGASATEVPRSAFGELPPELKSLIAKTAGSKANVALRMTGSQFRQPGTEHITEINVSAHEIEHMRSMMKGFSNVSVINLKGLQKNTKQHLKNLAELPLEIRSKITHLDLSSSAVDDATLELLQYLPQLRSLDLGRSRGVTNDGLVYIGDLSNLQSLTLIRCVRIRDEGIAHLHDLKNLNTLKLDGCGVSDLGLKHLEGLTQLESLSMKSCRISGKGFAHLKSLTQLKTLDLHDTDLLEDEALEHLKAFKNLETLGATGCKITDEGLVHIEKLLKLRTLDLTMCPGVNGGGLVHLKDLTRLESLTLNLLSISDESVCFLKPLTQLKNLDLFGCQKITDDGLQHLVHLPQLESLDLRNSQGITQRGIIKFKAATQSEHMRGNGLKSDTDGFLPWL